MFREISLIALLLGAIMPLSGCMVPNANLARSAASVNLDGTPQDVQVYPLGSMGTVESINTEHLAEQTMDSSDQFKILEAVGTNPTYKSSSWVNPTTGARFTVVPTTNTITVKGNKNCRRYRVIVMVNGQKGHLQGLACKQENGSWQQSV